MSDVPSTPPPAESAPLVEWALWYAVVHDWLVFPLHTPGDGGCSCGNGECRNFGKHPRTPNGFKDATTDPDQIRRWWEQWPSANIGSPYPSVLDCDLPRGSDPDEGVAEFRRLEQKHGRIRDAA